MGVGSHMGKLGARKLWLCSETLICSALPSFGGSRTLMRGW